MRNDFESNYLQHWGIKKGEKAKNHKYFERVEKNGKYIYFYTQAEYERWLHGAKPKVEGAKNKVKSALSSLKSKLTKSNLINAIARGKDTAYTLATRSRTALTKSNVNSVIDRGNKTISSLLNRVSTTANKTAQNIQKQVTNTAKNVQKAVKNATPKLQKKAQTIASNVERTLKKTGKDTQKAVKKYMDTGQKTINSVLKKAGNTKLSSTNKVGGIGTAIVASIIATAAVAAVAAIYKFIKDHVTEEVTITVLDTDDDNPWKEEPNKNEDRREEEERQRQIDENGAEDKFKENVAEHSDIPAKEESTTKDEDMAIINEKQKQLESEVNAIADEFNDIWAKYEETGNLSYYLKAAALYEEYLKKDEEYQGYWNNCANCTLTYDLRRRGYDVDAPWNGTGTYPDTIYDWYKISNRDIDHWGADNSWAPMSKSDAKAIINDIKDKYPEGSYGHFMVQWGTEDEPQGGHDCVWSIENGEVIIRDCQTNEICDPETYIMNSWDVEYFRADDKELTDAAYDAAKADYIDADGYDITRKKEKDFNKKKKK